MKKRILVLLIAVLLMGTMVCPATAEETETGTSYQVEFLTKLGVLPADFETEAELTKSEFVALVMNALGGADNYSAGNTIYFLDVPQNRADFSVISAAAAIGIIRGEENYCFYPDKTVTYEEAVNIAVNAMGYTVKAVVGGGWSVGYLTVAQKIGILSNVETSSKGGNLANLIFNMMKEPMLNQSVISDSYITYEENDDDYTILNVYWGIKYGKGQVTETSYTSQTGAGRLRDGDVKIDDVTYSEEDTDASSYFGYRVEFFYKDENEEINPLVYVYTKDNYNSKQTIAAEDIQNVDLQSGTISYYNGNKTNREKLATAVYVVYNGVILTDYNKEDLMPEYGSVQLLDNNNDGLYEYIFVHDVHYFVVGSVSESAEKIYEKYTGETLDLSDKNASVKIVKNGAETALSSLQEFNVLSVQSSRDASKIEIEVSDTVVKGKVEEINSEGDVTINGTVYEVYSGIENEPKLEETGAFYISADNLIVALEQTHVKRIAVVCELGSSTALTSTYQMKVVTDSGEAIWNLATKVKLNGTSMTAAEAIRTLQGIYSSSSASRIIDYEQNSSGEVQTINTPQDNTDGHMEYDETVLTMDFKSGSTSYRYFRRMLGAKWLVSENCTVVYTPTPSADGTLDVDYVTVGKTGLLSSAKTYNKFNLFSVDEYQRISVIEFTEQTQKNNTRGLSYDAKAFIIDKIARETDSNGNQATKIYGYQGGAYTSALFTADTEVDTIYPNTVSTPIHSAADLKVGDMLQISKDGEEISAYRLLYNIVDGTEEKTIMSHLGSGYNGYPHIETVMGTVERIASDVLIVKVGDNKELYLPSGCMVYKYEDGEIEEAAIGDIEANAVTGHGSKVLVHANQRDVQEIIIFE